MYGNPPAVNREFLAALDQESIPSNRKPYFLKWLRYYLDFCRRYSHLPVEKSSLDAFLIKLSEKVQDSFRQQQAANAIGIYWKVQSKEREQRGDAADSSVSRTAPEDKWDRVVLALKQRIQTLQYSKKTYATYSHWLRRFQAFTQTKDPDEITAKDAAGFFTYLATVKNVASSTQNQAFNALLFVFRHIWNREFEGFDGVVRSKRSN